MTRLVVLAVAVPAVLAAQTVPAPCVHLGQQTIVKQCLARDAALADSVLAVTLRSAVEAQAPAARDSFAADQRAWLAAHERAMAAIAEPTARLAASLVAVRARTFTLQHHMLVAAASADSSRMRAPPITAVFRAASGDRGSILMLTNVSNVEMTIEARLFNPATGALRTQSFVLLPSRRIEIGWIEGWPFAPGHLVELLHARYAPKLIVAP